MTQYTVIAAFKDVETGCVRKPGESMDVDGERANLLIAKGVIRAVDASGITAVGGGYYLLPNGAKVRGKVAAQKALQDLQTSEAAETDLKKIEAGEAS